MSSHEDNVRAVWSDDELDRALAALQPVPEPNKHALDRIRADLLVAAGARMPVGEPTRSWRRWSWWLAAVGTVVAVMASVLIVQTVQFGDETTDAAAGQLYRAADRITAVDVPLGPGQYRYVATHAWWMNTFDEDYAYLAENVEEVWIPADQTQEWLWRRDVTGARKWLVGSETKAKAEGIPLDEPDWPEGEWRAPCGDWYATEAGRKPCTAEGNWQSPDTAFLSTLPRDPAELYDRLRTDTAGQGNDADLEMVVYVADVLRTGRVPADLRASLYRVLAKVPGLEITDRVANVDGHKGTAFGISAAGFRHDVIIDPVTGQFIGEREITEDDLDGIPAGTVTEYTSVATTVVAGMGVRPSG
ncbi:CU044_5270 family protein [Actinophytocola sp.]|uniref:CU044_5270 family protein n=1 Tax=Actinophytocola sp. TaxID=1872138 RepID=UPI002ED05F61